jgi:hypothetical protein
MSTPSTQPEAPPPTDGVDKPSTRQLRPLLSRYLPAHWALCGEYPEFASPFNSIGFMDIRVGRFSSAIRDFDSAMRLDPSDTLALLGSTVAIHLESTLGVPDVSSIHCRIPPTIVDSSQRLIPVFSHIASSVGGEPRMEIIDAVRAEVQRTKAKAKLGDEPPTESVLAELDLRLLLMEVYASRSPRAEAGKVTRRGGRDWPEDAGVSSALRLRALAELELLAGNGLRASKLARRATHVGAPSLEAWITQGVVEWKLGRYRIAAKSFWAAARLRNRRALGWSIGQCLALSRARKAPPAAVNSDDRPSALSAVHGSIQHELAELLAEPGVKVPDRDDSSIYEATRGLANLEAYARGWCPRHPSKPFTFILRRSGTGVRLVVSHFLHGLARPRYLQHN